MPKSKVRKKAVYTPPTDRRTPVKVKSAGPSHPIYVAVMIGVMVLGLAWLVVNYIAGKDIRPRELELRHRVRADDRRAPDDDEVALTVPTGVTSPHSPIVHLSYRWIHPFSAV